MSPTLVAGDFIAVDTRYEKPRIGDVVVFQDPRDPRRPFSKRVAAVGGDTIEITDGHVVVNGNVLETLAFDEKWRRQNLSTSMAAQKVPTGNFFVLGDWRDKSNDSRFFGSVPDDNLIGRVSYIWYSNDLGRVGRNVR